MNANTLKPCMAADLFNAMRTRETLICAPTIAQGSVEPFPVNINCMEAEDGSGTSWNVDVLILDMRPIVATVHWNEKNAPKFFFPA